MCALEGVDDRGKPLLSRGSLSVARPLGDLLSKGALQSLHVPATMCATGVGSTHASCVYVVRRPWENHSEY